MAMARYEYSRHATHEEATAAIEDYQAAGIIDWLDNPVVSVDPLSRIGLTRRPFRVMLAIWQES